ncbi:hypothetical protein LTS08_008697 [Lithohypha guttulata]|uniref:GST N-terminal domain-containing protein n=1 Tax=Lithohypha guttulata TaxID=1690604 RepID=A0AAN7YAW5_9EURO|nr:hypothetical protein LTR05_001850 [Lithohypha guttulata]KAK5094206.1 hypothetical protein LTS08_008697 [Lithohypha guttulata]
MASVKRPPIALFGYDSSPFTQKVRLALRLMRIPYTYVLVPSMMPRPILVNNFNLTYRKIPVLAIGKEVFADTSLIVEWLDSHPAIQAHDRDGTIRRLHEDAGTRVLSRLLTSYVTDRPLFRLTTGLIPSVVWRSHFGTDRAELIGHKLDPDKLEGKVSLNLAGLDTFLSIIEPLFAGINKQGRWILGGKEPSAIDIGFYYQLDWGEKISRGDGIRNLTGGEIEDGTGRGASEVFNQERYPGVWDWFHRFEKHVESLPDHETRIEQKDEQGLEELLSKLEESERSDEVPLLPTPNQQLQHLEEQNGLRIGAKASVRPADTGQWDPTVGTLVGISPEEVVIEPDKPGVVGKEGTKARIEGIRLHFPRIEFVVRPAKQSASKL